MKQASKKRSSPRHLEDNLQQMCVQWFRLTHKNRIIFAIPNGGKRNKFEAFRLKKQGVLAGVPDLFLAASSKTSHGLFVELKTENGRLTNIQREVHELLMKAGYTVLVAYSFDEFKKIVSAYLSAL